MHGRPMTALFALVLVPLLSTCGGDAPADEAPADAPGQTAETGQTAEPGTDEWKIGNAESAAPPEIAAGAAIMDWPEEEGAATRELRPGTNGFTCFPDNPDTDGNDPMCLDDPWMRWAEAYMQGGEPDVDRVGISYMLAGDGGVSNIDPYDYAGPTPDNEWVRSGPHIMVLMPDVAALEGVPTDPGEGGPFLMWRDTPYAHIMVPIPER